MTLYEGREIFFDSTDEWTPIQFYLFKGVLELAKEEQNATCYVFAMTNI